MCGPGLVGRTVSSSCVCLDLALLVGGFLVPVGVWTFRPVYMCLSSGGGHPFTCTQGLARAR